MESRIDQGLGNGTMTGKQAEQARLNKSQNKNSKRIYKQKHS
jgi:hypothetical protein